MQCVSVKDIYIYIYFQYVRNISNPVMWDKLSTHYITLPNLIIKDAFHDFIPQYAKQ